MFLDLPTFVFLNGPTDAGKSTLASLIVDLDQHTMVESLAEPIRQMIYGTFFPEEGPIDYSFDLRDSKTKRENLFTLAKLNFESRPDDEIPPADIRDTMIDFADDFMRAKFGTEIFGRLLLKRCLEQQQFYKHFIIDDVGFTDEVKFIVNFVGPDNCHLIRIHRAGFEFRGDNRNYISLPGVQTLDLNNNGDPDEMLDTLAAEFRAAEPPTLDTL